MPFCPAQFNVTHRLYICTVLFEQINDDDDDDDDDLSLIFCEFVVQQQQQQTTTRPFVRDYPGEPVPER